MLGNLLTFFVVGIVTILVAGVVLSILGAVLGIASGLASLLLFKVGPILLLGWVVVKVIESRKKKTDYLSEADRRWLDGE